MSFPQHHHRRQRTWKKREAMVSNPLIDNKADSSDQGKGGCDSTAGDREGRTVESH